MDAVINYDVSGRHTDVKARMRALGYSDRWGLDGTTYYLPNTTLWKQETELATAVQDIQTVAGQLQVRLERAVALKAQPWFAIAGDPHSQ